MKPMLASAVKDSSKLSYPILVSPKLDGIRALAKDNQLYSRSLKPIRNRFIQQWFRFSGLPDGLDGELIVGDERDSACFQSSTSGVMSEDGEPDFKYFIFDSFSNPNAPYTERYNTSLVAPRVVVVENVLCHTWEEVQALAEKFVKDGYEGAMLRSPHGKYKYGRSTEKEGYLLKLKPFCDMEGEVVGYSELHHNHNEAQLNEVGNMQRSSAKENMVAGDTLGALVIKAKGFDTFSIGTGFSAALRASLWDSREELIGKLVKFKYQTIGSKDRPRLPVFLGFRDEDDL